MFDRNIATIPHAAFALALCAACSALSAALILGQSVSLAVSINAAWLGELTSSFSTPFGSMSSLAVFVGAFALCYALRHLENYFRGEYMAAFALRATQHLRAEALEGLYDKGNSYLYRHGTGALTTLLSEGLEEVRNYLAIIVPKISDIAVIPLIVGVALIFVDPISGFISLALIPFVVFYLRMLGSYSKERAASQRAQYDQLTNRFANSLQGISTLIAFGAEKAEAEEILDQGEQLREATVNTLKAATLSSLVLDLFSVFALAAVAILLGFRLLSGDISLTRALVVLIAVPEIFATIRRYSSDFHASLNGRNSLASLLDLASPAVPQSTIAQGAPSDDTSGTNIEAPAHCPSSNQTEVAPQQQPLLVLDKVSFRYEDNDASAEAEEVRPQSLSDISLSLSAPLKLGVVGTSGAGKSTLAMLLAGLISPTSGSIDAPGCQPGSAPLTQEAWRSRVLYIPQSPTIFNASVAANVSFYQPEASNKEINTALEKAGLSEFINTLPQGAQTRLGLGSRMLSGGQAQRIALARGFLCNTRDVVIFDEPTAHLDVQSEAALKPDMLKLMEGKLAIVATHRLHWMKDMDLIIVLEEGRIAQIGTLSQIEGTGGAYDRMAARLRRSTL